MAGPAAQTQAPDDFDAGLNRITGDKPAQAAPVEDFDKGLQQIVAPKVSRGTSRSTPATGDDIQRATRAAQAFRKAGFSGEKLTTMVAIAGAESGWKPGQRFNNPATGDDSYGLAQINYYDKLREGRTRQFGPPHNMFDPDLNAKAAKALYDARNGFGDWSTYRRGDYRKFLDTARQVTGSYHSFPEPTGDEVRAAAHTLGLPKVAHIAIADPVEAVAQRATSIAHADANRWKEIASKPPTSSTKAQLAAIEMQIEHYRGAAAIARETAGEMDQATELKRMSNEEWIASAVGAPISTIRALKYGFTPKEYHKYTNSVEQIGSGVGNLATQLNPVGAIVGAAGLAANTAETLKNEGGVEALKGLNPLGAFWEPGANFADKTLAVINTAALLFGAGHAVKAGIAGIRPAAEVVPEISAKFGVPETEARNLYDSSVRMLQHDTKGGIWDMARSAESKANKAQGLRARSAHEHNQVVKADVEAQLTAAAAKRQADAASLHAKWTGQPDPNLPPPTLAQLDVTSTPKKVFNLSENPKQAAFQEQVEREASNIRKDNPEMPEERIQALAKEYAGMKKPQLKAAAQKEAKANPQSVAPVAPVAGVAATEGAKTPVAQPRFSPVLDPIDEAFRSPKEAATSAEPNPKATGASEGAEPSTQATKEDTPPPQPEATKATEGTPPKVTRRRRVSEAEAQAAAKKAIPDGDDSPTPKTTGLANQVQNREAVQGWFNKIEPGHGQSPEEWQQQGKKFAEDNNYTNQHFIDLASRIAKGTEDVTPLKGAVLLEGKRRLVSEVNAAMEASDKSPGNRDALDRLDAARDTLQNFLNDVQKGPHKAFNDFGMVLQAGTTLDEGNPAEVLAELRRRNPEAANDHAAVKMAKDLKASQASEAKLREELAAAMAEREASTANKVDRGQPKGKTKKQTIQDQIDTHLANLKALEEGGNVGGGTRRGAVTKITAEDVARFADRAKEIGGLALQYAKLGAANLEEIVQKVQTTLKEHMGWDVDRQAIIDSFAMPGKLRARSEIQKQIAVLKSEAKGQSTAKVQAIEKSIADLQEQLRTKKYVRPTPREVKATEDILDLQSKQRKLRNSVRQAIAREGETGPQKALRLAVDLPRADKLLGHGGVTMNTHSGKFWFRPTDVALQARSWLDANVISVKPAVHERLMQEMEGDKDYPFAMRVGLASDTSVAVDDAAKINSSLGKLSAMGNRGMDALKLMRFRLWKRWSPVLLKGLTGEDRLQTAKDLAQNINVATGHGKSWGKAGQLFLSSSLESSHWAKYGETGKTAATLYKMAKGTATAGEKRLALYRVAKAAEYIGTYAAAKGINQGILHATGQKDQINFNDPTKSDFCSMKWNGKTYGIQGAAFAAELLLARVGHILWAGSGRSDKTTKEALWETLGKYVEGHFTPTVSAGLQGATGENFAGRPLPAAINRPWQPGVGQKAVDEANLKASLNPDKLPAESGGEVVADLLFPIWAEGGATEVYDEVRKHTGDDMAQMLLNGAATSGKELLGIRIGHEPKPPKDTSDELTAILKPLGLGTNPREDYKGGETKEAFEKRQSAQHEYVLKEIKLIQNRNDYKRANDAEKKRLMAKELKRVETKFSEHEDPTREARKKKREATP